MMSISKTLLLQNALQHNKIHALLFSTSMQNLTRGRLNINSSEPGISRRMKIMKEDTPDIATKAPVGDDDIENMEADIMQARGMQEFHDRVANQINKKIERSMIERNYFKKQASPNMLTWSEKEQIKHLHSEDPQKWNIERLSSGFPATPEIILKIIKSQWKPYSADRIRRHDENVAKNWEKFFNNSLEVGCPALKEHLQKFSKREPALVSGSAVTTKSLAAQIPQLPKPQSSEYYSIIESYRNRTKNSEQTMPKNMRITQGQSEDIDLEDNLLEERPSFEHVKWKDRRRTTLSELREAKKKELEFCDTISKVDSMFLSGAKSTDTRIVRDIEEDSEALPVEFQVESKEVESKDIEVSLQQQETTVSAPEVSTPSPGNLTRYERIPNYIRIPKKLVKVGSLYKVKDCFYSHDGYFLYRVPGIV